MKKKTDKLFDTAIVSKRNVLNEIRKNNMSLQELRFFSIYLSKINSHDISTRVVRFPLSDFQKIMEIGADMNINHFRTAIRKLLQQIVEVPSENGYGYTAFQLFKECTLERDKNDEWYVEIDAHDKALPLMFDFKNKYFSYELWNAIRLKSPNQVRMYEILKQYEKLGKREISVPELRELLGISPKEYERWDNFKRKVLDSCQKALKENTDICYTYERGKSGAGGKWLTIIFHISKNNGHKNKLSLEEFIDMQPNTKIIDITAESEITGKPDSTAFDDDKLSDNFETENFQEVELKVLKVFAEYTLNTKNETDISDFINFCKIRMEKTRIKGKKISSPTDYLCKIMENSAEEFKKAKLKREENEQSYDINEFEKYAINYQEIQKIKSRK